MKLTMPVACYFLFAFLPTLAQNRPVGIFDGQQDIGYVKQAGSSTYDSVTQSYLIKGAGGEYLV